MKIFRTEILFYVFIIILCIALFFFFFLHLISEWKNNSLFMQFSVEKISSYLVESFREQRLEDAINVYRNDVRGFGIYKNTGESILTYGSAPGRLSIKEYGLNRWIPRNKNNSVILIRPLGMMRGMGMHNMMTRNSFRLLFLEVNLRAYFVKNNYYIAASVIFPILFVSIIIVLFLFFNIIQKYRRRLLKQDELARLGEASRTLTHEIKNPLSAIKLQTSYLKKMVPENIKPELRVIEEEVDRLSQLTSRINEFLKDPSGTPERIELISFINNLIKKFENNIIFHGITDREVYVTFDPQRLRSVLENIIINAGESYPDSEENKAIDIEVSIQKNMAFIKIMDRGSGIRWQNADKLFDPFYTTKIKGSGIGLAVSKRFIESQSGTLIIAPRQAGGTEVRITLPLS